MASYLDRADRYRTMMTGLPRLLARVGLVLVATLGVAAPAANAAAPVLQPLAATGPTHVPPQGTATMVIYAWNVGSAPTTGSYVVDVDLPDQVATTATPSGNGWSCNPAGAGSNTFSCTSSVPVPGGLAAEPVLAPIAVNGVSEGVSNASITVSGGGTALVGSYDMPITVSSTPVAPGLQAFFAGAYDADGRPETRAGAHPATAVAGFLLNTVTTSSGTVRQAGSPRDVTLRPPLGFIGNPLATPRCQRNDGGCGSDDPDVLLGRVQTVLSNLGGAGMGLGFPVSNIVPGAGTAAEFRFPVSYATVTTVGQLRPDDFGVEAVSPNVPADYKPFGAFVSLWGDPGAGIRDELRCTSSTIACQLPNPGGVDTAFLTNPTTCTGQLARTFLTTNSWQLPLSFSTLDFGSPAITDCDEVPFEPTVSSAVSSAKADAPSGLDFDVTVDQSGLLDPEGIAPSHIDDVTVDLPEGLAVNPSGATGLAACSDAQMTQGTMAAPTCPDAAKIGTVEITSPLVDRAIGGTLYLGTPKSTDPTSGEMLRLWVVARDDPFGVMVKLPGSATADPATGKLTATFENNPQLPFGHLSVKLRGGEQGLLATPQTCGNRSISSTLSPWSGSAPVTQGSPVDTTERCGLGFAPSVRAGMSSSAARGSGTYSFTFSREDGEQWVDGLTAKLPKGLLASVKDVPLCSNAQAAFGACPDGSRVGTVDASAGAGDPFVLEKKGTAYLTEGYKGCAYGLLVSVPVVAGPFDASSRETDLGSVNVRQAVCVDPSTAEITAISDPLPTIWHGIPLRVRSVTVSVDRPGFMLNPSDCDATQTSAVFDSDRGATASTSSPFRASGCASLRFKPGLTLALTGRKQVTTGKHPGVKAVVRQAGTSEAGIERAVVRLPKSLALDPSNAQALCEFAEGTKSDLENHCPKGSIVGRARAKTPLLKNDLAGNVYFVKNVRIDPKTGNRIRTLPMIVVALRGEIAINLKGVSSTTKNGRLVNTFASVPDAPISQFNLNIKGGSKGILAVTQTRKGGINLCASRQIAEADTDGQNGRRHDFDVRIKTPCTKAQVKKAKRAAARRAAKG